MKLTFSLNERARALRGQVKKTQNFRASRFYAPSRDFVKSWPRTRQGARSHPLEPTYALDFLETSSE